MGLLAQKCFDGGVEIVEEYHKIDATIRSTREAVAKNPPAVFEAAACSPDGAYSRIDILRKCLEEGVWDLVEVKSTTSVKDYHIDDMALQRYAFAGEGYDIGWIRGACGTDLHSCINCQSSSFFPYQPASAPRCLRDGLA
ncbi:MAG: hypothetical protein U5R30_08360 [Deltaproteobacteria bacterium]|nr:hypothetical protein [Deltaproteobacteria bacterium]